MFKSKFRNCNVLVEHSRKTHDVLHSCIIDTDVCIDTGLIVTTLDVSVNRGQSKSLVTGSPFTSILSISLTRQNDELPLEMQSTSIAYSTACKQ